MSEKVYLAIIIAVALVICIAILRKKIGGIFFKGMGIDANMKTHKNSGVTISSSELTGLNVSMNIEHDDVSINKVKESGINVKLNIKK